jgi:hypothetical protein
MADSGWLGARRHVFSYPGNSMTTSRQNTAWGLRGASGILLLCIIHASNAAATEPHPAQIAIAEGGNTRFAHLTNADFRGGGERRADSIRRDPRNIQAQAGHAGVRDVRFAHLTTNDGLSQGYVTAILQDRRGFMWFATRDGLNRYDGNTFVVYKNNANDPGSLSSNFLQDLLEDDHGYLWIATDTGVDKFDPTTERCIRYLHDARGRQRAIASRIALSIRTPRRLKPSIGMISSMIWSSVLDWPSETIHCSN